MKKFHSLSLFHKGLLLLIVILIIVTMVFALKTKPSTTPFTVLARPATPAVTADGKIPVRAFFMYHCQYCYESERTIDAWAKGKESTIHFERIAMPSTTDNDPEARLFLTLVAMGIEESLHSVIMKSIHEEGNRFYRDTDSILNWIAQQGIDQERFHATWNSPTIEEQLRNLPSLIASYEVAGTPSLVVGGRFLTSPSSVKQASREADPITLEQTLDQLIKLSKEAEI